MPPDSQAGLSGARRIAPPSQPGSGRLGRCFAHHVACQAARARFRLRDSDSGSSSLSSTLGEPRPPGGTPLGPLDGVVFPPIPVLLQQFQLFVQRSQFPGHARSSDALKLQLLPKGN